MNVLQKDRVIINGNIILIFNKDIYDKFGMKQIFNLLLCLCVFFLNLK